MPLPHSKPAFEHQHYAETSVIGYTLGVTGGLYASFSAVGQQHNHLRVNFVKNKKLIGFVDFLPSFCACVCVCVFGASVTPLKDILEKQGGPT